MRNKIILITGLLFIGLVITDSLNNHALTNSSAAPAGNTGSPFDGVTCAQAGCHNVTAVNQPGLITSDIPAGGYIAGTTYTITATVADLTSSFNKFGFQVSPQSNSGTLLGTLIVTNTTQTQLVGSGKYITHKSAGTTGTGNSKTWSFNWTAPATGTGDVTFYGAFNAADGNGLSTGDVISTSTLVIPEHITSSVHDPNNDDVLKVFPNPVSNQLTVSLKSMPSEAQGFVEIISIDGKLIKKIGWENRNSGNLSRSIKIDVLDLNAGIYFINIKMGEHNYIEKVVKK